MPKRPIYYDTETTGIRSDKDRLVELAAYDPVKDKSFVSLIHPGFPIPVEASSIHHITDEMVKNAPSFDVVIKDFLNFCEGDVVLIAHNNDSFDKLFLQEEFKRVSIPFPDWKFIDSLKWSRKYRSDLPRHSLQYLREVYGIQANNAHRALDDVMVLYQIFSTMIDDLSMEKVIELLEKPSVILRMPFGKHQGKPLSEIPKDYIAWLKSSGAFDKASNQELKASFHALGMLEKA